MALAGPALREVLENRDALFSVSARSAAVRALGELLPAGQGEPLAVAARDGEAAVSIAAIGALADRNEDSGAEAVMGLLEDQRGFFLPLTRQAAARAVAAMRRASERRLSALLEREIDPVVTEAMASLRSPVS